MLLLLVASLVSWKMIFQKHALLKRARFAAEEFEEQFWSGQDLEIGRASCRERV